MRALRRPRKAWKAGEATAAVSRSSRRMATVQTGEQRTAFQLPTAVTPGGARGAEPTRIRGDGQQARAPRSLELVAATPRQCPRDAARPRETRSEEHTSEL